MPEEFVRPTLPRIANLPISVIIPVGPSDENTLPWLIGLIGSIRAQTSPPDEIVIVDDAAHISSDFEYVWFKHNYDVTIIRNDWNLGEAASRNIGIARARNEWVFQASHDDLLLPRCLEQCWKARENARNDRGYYWVTVSRGATDEVQADPGCHALFSKGLWRYLGGYPLCGALGLADIAFIDLVLVHGWLYYVSTEPLYWHREHDRNQVKVIDSVTKELARAASNEHTRRWTHPEWADGFA